MVIPDSLFITVVSGLPRSGTSLMMQMLSAGGMSVLTDQVRAADEDNPKGYLEFEAVKNLKTSSAWLDQAEGKAVKMVHLLLLNLPPESHFYRVLFMKRHISEVLASQRTMLDRHRKSGAALSDEQLAKIFLSQLERVENWMKGQPHFLFLPIDYNQLMRDPSPQANAINQFLGSKLDVEKMIQSVDANLYRQRMAPPA